MANPFRHPHARGAAVVAATLAVASLLLAAGRPGVVTTREQQTFEGDVTETDTTVTVVRGGLRATLARGDVASIEYATYAERFDKQLAALPAGDVAARVTLARQAFDRREFDLAQKAVDAALEIDPLDRDARRMTTQLGAQLQLGAKQSARDAAGAAAPASRPTTAAAGRTPTRERRFRGLNEREINLVRQGELRRDDRVRIRFRENVRKRYVESQPGLSFREFSTLSDVDQALAILTRGPRELAEHIDVQSDPAAIQNFVRRLQGPVIQGCATSYCHGGDNAGSFKLLSGVPDPSTAITNFYLLNAWSKERADQPGLFGGGALEMVSRGRAEESILFQYALPRSQAKLKHPAVRGWDGIVRDRRDRVAVDLAEWIDRDLSPIRPTYDFQFSPFVAPPASTQPADAPATEPAAAATATTRPAE